MPGQQDLRGFDARAPKHKPAPGLVERFVNEQLPCGMQHSRLRFADKLKYYLALQTRRLLRLGADPDFIIVGYPKAGTSTLYNYLCRHPRVANNKVKEIYFFNVHFGKGRNWYRANFFKTAPDQIIGESTVEYVADKDVPARVSALYPKMKIIIMLRDPIDRAYSHYNMHRKYGITDKTFDEVIDTELALFKSGRIEQIDKFQRYVTGYQYLDGIRQWTAEFGKENVLIIGCEDFFAYPEKYFPKIFRFLGLPPQLFTNLQTINKGEYSEKMSAQARKKLAIFYKPYNEALYKYLKKDFGWK